MLHILKRNALNQNMYYKRSIRKVMRDKIYFYVKLHYLYSSNAVTNWIASSGKDYSGNYDCMHCKNTHDQRFCTKCFPIIVYII